MPRSFLYFFAALALTIFSLAGVSAGRAQTGEPWLALVIGNAQYRQSPLATPANDAGLVAQALQAAGFDVTGAADLDQQGLRQAFRDFLDKVRNAGPNGIVFVYLSGRGLQYAGENYFAPVDATITRDSDVPVEALRLADYTQALAGLQLKARIIVLDAARANDYAKAGAPLAGGLALLDAESGSLYAFNAAPGTIAPDEQGPYGVYAQALVEMMHQGYPANEIFTQTRLRVSQASAGSTIPWNVSKLDAPILFFQRDTALPKPPDLNRPLRDYSAAEAYAVALNRDTIAGYQEFLAAYPSDPLARRVRALLAARREALTWRRALDANAPQAYWTYMRRYPHGPHFADARRRLVMLTAPLDPPPRFDPYDFEDLAPPPEAEYGIVDRPVVTFADPDYPPPPPFPVFLLGERPREFVDLPPPPRHEHGFLPVPAPIPVPFSHPVAPQRGSINPPRLGQQQQSPNQPGQSQTIQQPQQQPNVTPPQGHELPKPGVKPEHAVPLQQTPSPNVTPPQNVPPQNVTPPQGHELPKPGVKPEHVAPSQPTPQQQSVPPQNVAPPQRKEHVTPEHVVPPPHKPEEHVAPPHTAPPPQHKPEEHAAPPHPTPPPPPKPEEHAAPPHPTPPPPPKPQEHAAPPRPTPPPQKPPPKKDEHPDK